LAIVKNLFAFSVEVRSKSRLLHVNASVLVELMALEWAQ
jgi:hypothetical protein